MTNEFSKFDFSAKEKGKGTDFSTHVKHYRGNAMQIMAYWGQNSPTTNHRSETSLVSEGSLIIQTSSRHAECCLMVIFLYMYDMIYNPRSCSLGT